MPNISLIPKSLIDLTASHLVWGYFMNGGEGTVFVIYLYLHFCGVVFKRFLYSNIISRDSLTIL